MEQIIILKPAEVFLNIKGEMIYAVLLLVSMGFMTRSVFTAASFALKGKQNTSQFLYKVPLLYDVLIQLVTGSALLLSIVLRIHGNNSTSEPLLLGYIFSLELINMWTSRQAQNPLRKIVHRHVIGLLTLTSSASMVIKILPLLVISPNLPLRPVDLAMSLLLVACIVIILFTPRSVVIDNHVNEHYYSKKHTNRSQEICLPTPSPEECCCPFAYCISYGWLTNLIFWGYNHKLSMEDLPPLPHYDEPLIWLTRVLEARQRGVSTLKTIALLLYREIATQIIFAIMTALVEFVAPFAMYKLLSFLQDPEDATIRPFLWVVLLFLGPVVRSICYQQYIFTSTRLIVRIKIAFVQEIYHKALESIISESSPKGRNEVQKEDSDHFGGSKPIGDELRPSEGEMSEEAQTAHSQEGESGAGHIINLMSFDTDAIESARDVVLLCTAVPLEVAIAMTFLYTLIGWSAMAGLTVMILSISLPTFFSHKMVQIQQHVMARSDKRISMISEYLNSIRIIKYFGWEGAMAAKVKDLRRLEQIQIWKRNIFSIAVVWSGDFIPLFSLLVMFSSYTLGTGQPLRAATAFTCLSITETLRQQFVWLSNISGFISQAAVSLRRMDTFFRTAIPKTETLIGTPSFSHATLLRSPNGSFRLHDMNITFLSGCLNVITGPTGSGKTTMLLSLLGETILENGEVTCPRDVAYVSQAAWLWSGTVRDNILFYSEFAQSRYDAAAKACGLLRDFSELPQGDLTQVGEQGAALSGGQRQRVALARAVYSKASTLLLDDTFSALDITTTSLIFNELFRKEFLGERTVVLVSHLPSVIDAAQFIVKLDNGRIESQKRQTPSFLSKPTEAPDVRTVIHGQSYSTALEESPVMSKSLERTLDGRIPRNLFLKYMLHFGSYSYALLAFFTAFCTQIGFFSLTLWLSVWTGAYTKEGAINVGFYLGTYACILLGFNIMVPLNNTVFQLGAWRAARTLHNRLTDKVLGIPLKWFDENPLGTVLNRFSSDIGSLDSKVVNWLRMTLDNQIRLVLRIGAIASILPIFAVPAAILCSIGFGVGEVYTRAQISIKRLTSATQSPVFTHFSETLTGLPTIRAQHGMNEMFGLVLADHMRNYAIAFEALYNSNRWVSVRADTIAACVAASAGGIAIVKAGSISAGLVGFSLTNAIGLSQTILSLVRNMNELEVELNSFQRVLEFSKMKSEKDDIDLATEHTGSIQRNITPPAIWPASGKVTLSGFSASYSREGPDVLKNITFEARPGERIGIVGRTGSGKSSLGLSLLRFTQQTAGSIFIDGIDISKIDLTRLRQVVTLIPQEPTLFAGDIRSNLDPFDELEDAELNGILRECGCLGETPPLGSSYPSQIKVICPVRQDSDETISSSSRTKSLSNLHLSTPVTTGGENFSRGQRQVLCMARAMCRRSNIVVLDEATSSVDEETDLRIQEVLRTGFPGRTVFTIAHRLKTIVDHDRVIVLSGGEIVEFDTPRTLFERKGALWKMIQETRDVDEIVQCMQ